jgi:hypothetical protein
LLVMRMPALLLLLLVEVIQSGSRGKTRTATRPRIG